MIFRNFWSDVEKKKKDAEEFVGYNENKEFFLQSGSISGSDCYTSSFVNHYHSMNEQWAIMSPEKSVKP